MQNRILSAMSLVLVLLFSLLPVNWGVNAADHTYTVLNTNGSGVDSLRWAINQANTYLSSTETIDIVFDLPDSDPNYNHTTGVWTITVNSALPAVIAGHTTIDGYSQSGAAQGTSTRSPTLVIEIDGSNLVVDPPLYGNSGFNVLSTGNTITGLVINNFPVNGISIAGAAARNNLITGNCIGSDYECAHNEGNAGDGVFIGLGAKNNTVGGEAPEDGNIMLFNNLDGVGIHGSGTDDNTVSGNIIMSNDFHGVFIYGGAQNNTVGGDTTGERNLISTNHRDGVRIHGSGTDGNIIVGNYIGTVSFGDFAIPNDENGVQISHGAQNNLIGGSVTNTGNLISGNLRSGVIISGTNTMSNTVAGNIIGTTFDTSAALLNAYGIQITAGAQYNLVGGESEDERNIISGNLNYGVYLANTGTAYNTIVGNFIGSDLTGTAALGNRNGGVKVVDGAAMNTIGGVAAGQRNLISGNQGYGVWLSGTDVTDNQVIGNFIGTNITGTQVISNTKSGVFMDFGAHDNVIGGDSPGEGNLISGNGAFGVEIYWGANHNTVSGNNIGTDVGGTRALGNTRHGVAINRSQGNVIGGDIDGEGNLISGNGESGVEIWHAAATGNTVSGNLIGTGKDGIQSVPNSEGIVIREGASDNVIGPGNIIANNTFDGVRVSQTDSINNVITQNSIFSNHQGILLQSGANGGISPPVITTIFSSGQVRGTACSNCTVEVFWSRSPDGEGEVYLGRTNASMSGTFTFALASTPAQNLTATATDSADGTSEFSAVYNPASLVYLPIMLNGE